MGWEGDGGRIERYWDGVEWDVMGWDGDTMG